MGTFPTSRNQQCEVKRQSVGRPQIESRELKVIMVNPELTHALLALFGIFA